MDFTEITYDVDGSIATITLDRPDKLNAFTPTMRTELIAALDAADADDGVRAVIFTGAGRGFCAGADLSSGGDTFDMRKRYADEHEIPRDGGGTVVMRIFEMRKPVIGAINGPAVGVGATMQLPMDVRIAAESARFGFVFTRRGIVPEAASSWFLPRVVGISQAMEWVMTGRVFDAQEALAGGLVSRVVPDAELLATARALAEEIVASTAPVSVATARQMLWRMLAAPHPMDAHRLDSEALLLRGQSKDVVEGVEAFLEKRPAAFPDRVSDGMPDIFAPHPEY